MYSRLYEEFCVDMLYTFLNHKNFNTMIKDMGIKEAVKLITRLYPEIDENGQKAYGKSKNKIQMMMNYHKISDRALVILNSDINKDDLLKRIHFEHMNPNEQIYKNLIKFTIENHKISKKEIKEIMDTSEVVILTKEESHLIDKPTTKEVYLDGVKYYGAGLKDRGGVEERLKASRATFNNHTNKNSLV